MDRIFLSKYIQVVDKENEAVIQTSWILLCLEYRVE